MPNPPHVLFDDLERVELSLRSPPTRVANHARSTADKHDWSVASSLQMSQSHDRNQIPNMEAPRRRVESAVGNDRPRGEHLTSAFGVLK